MANFTSKYGLGDAVQSAAKKKQQGITGNIESVSFREDTIFYQVRFSGQNDDVHIWPFEECELKPSKKSND